MSRYPANEVNLQPVCPYCENRIRLMIDNDININRNVYNVYKYYIKWYDQYIINNTVVDDNTAPENESLLESYIPYNVDNNGTVYITQYYVDIYFGLVLVKVLSIILYNT